MTAMDICAGLADAADISDAALAEAGAKGLPRFVEPEPTFYKLVAVMRAIRAARAGLMEALGSPSE